MDCQKCNQRPAVVHITQFVNGKKQEYHLCEQCAQEVKAGLDVPHFPLQDLSNLLGFLTKSMAADNNTFENKCPNCRTAYRRISETGHVGCSVCYEHFSPQLDPVLRKIHGSNRHRGKIPEKTGASLILKREMEELKYNLKKAVELEEYEEAARLRDKIKLLEKGRGEK